MATDNTTAEKRDRLRRAWARGKLLPADDRLEGVRAAFWKVLVNSQGTPPSDQRLAYHVLADAEVWTSDPAIAIPPIVVAAADVAVEKQLSDAVEQFAAEFFALAPAQRRERFETLRTDVAVFPRLSRRLQAFAEVLDAAPVKNALDHPRERELATWLEKLCVASPSQRGAMRIEALNALKENPLNWPMVVRSLLGQDPTVVYCDRELLDAIEQEPERVLNQKRTQDQRGGIRIDTGQAKSFKTPTASSESALPKWLIFVLVIFGLRAFSALIVPGRQMDFMTPSAPNSGNPYYTPPGTSWKNISPMDILPRRIDPATGRNEIDLSKVGPAMRALLGHPPPTEAELEQMSPEMRSAHENAARSKLEGRVRKELTRPDAPP